MNEEINKTETASEVSLNSLLNGAFGYKYKGNDNYGKPKTEYLDKIIVMDEKQLLEETERKIWLSAYANNNGRSDYHWQCDACYEVAKKFGDLYKRAYKKVEASV